MDIVISVDVEEEGLFSGRYPREAAGVVNVQALERLEFLSRDFGLPLSLLLTHAVCHDSAAAMVVKRWRDSHAAELGAHLHPWSTPPFRASPSPEPIHPEALPEDLLRAKIDTLVEAHARRFGPPRAFRMGRFELGPRALALLPGYGFRVDSSQVPLRVVPGRIDHFLVPNDPFVIGDGATPLPFWEVPLTQEPLWRGLPTIALRATSALPTPARERWLALFRYLFVVGLAPAWFSLAAMQRAARLHRRRGGRVLHLFLHSSDLLPGGSPAARTPAHVERLLDRLRRFFEWLARDQPEVGVPRGLSLSGVIASGAAPDRRGTVPSLLVDRS
jgi:hypothetical protein